MSAGDTSRPGPVANFLFAAGWLLLGVWFALTPSPAPLRWLLVAGFLVLSGAYVVLGVRRLRARRAVDSPPVE